MIQVFSNLKTLVNARRRNTESLVFYLNYRVTFLVLIFCCVLVSTQQFAGQKIQCLSKPSGEISIELLNSYCWATSTYSVKSPYLEQAGKSEPHPGVGSTENESEYEYRNFYQYIHIILFIQAVLFYLPHLVWKSMEQTFMTNLSDVITLCKTDNGSKDKSVVGPTDDIAIYIEDRWGNQKTLALKYLFCELLSATNLIVQSYLLDVFFRGKFIGLGLLVDVYYGADILSDPIRLFPIVTICRFRRFGPSGYINVIDSLCVLPNNALNAKIFMCLWIWFLGLLILSCFSLVHLLISMLLPVYRILLVKSKSVFFKGSIDNESYMKLMMVGDFGDWFVLSSIKDSIDPLEFSRLMENLHGRLISLETERKEV